MSKNDDRIMLLKKQIDEKKVALMAAKSNEPYKTTCVIDLDGNKINIHVLKSDELAMLLVKLNVYRMSAENLGMQLFAISGYDVNMWMDDVKKRIAMLKFKETEKELRAAEDKLNALLSEDKKTELEIDNIEALLKA